MSILNTAHMSAGTKADLAFGLEARMQELIRDRKAGYGHDMTRGQRERLIRTARDTYALGIIGYLPEWAR